MFRQFPVSGNGARVLPLVVVPVPKHRLVPVRKNWALGTYSERGLCSTWFNPILHDVGQRAPNFVTFFKNLSGNRKLPRKFLFCIFKDNVLRVRNFHILDHVSISFLFFLLC